ncbi:hypothetical protein [Parachlamydia sp. AcF125]|uniref:hypothetical protein n=1 Tax=Parachlamydia sp. AcF125 TaxID=2795736 RepID=UPI001BCA6281|nr:hypothetical protein [Parachlamydia sp. AcF125]
MTFDPVKEAFETAREKIFTNFNRFSTSHKNLGRLLSLPIAIIDITLEIAASPVRSIQFAVAGVIILGGAVLSPKSGFEIKHSIRDFEKSLLEAARLPIKLIVAPLKIFYQTVVIAKNPQSVCFFNYKTPTFGSNGS